MLALSSLRFVKRGMTGVMKGLAVLLFIGANIVIGSSALGTLRLLLRGKLLPPSTFKSCLNPIYRRENHEIIQFSLMIATRWSSAPGLRRRKSTTWR